MLVSLGLVAIWALSGAGYFWPVWPIMGWGSACLAHGRMAQRVHPREADGPRRSG
jgi:hypothetical protein